MSVGYLFEQNYRGKMKIGVIGYSAQKFDENLAEKMIELGLGMLGAEKGDELVSGLTDLGIPGIAYRVGKKQNMILVGIACEKAHDFNKFPVDKEIIVGSNWGDESETFLNYIDCLLKIGGGSQSEDEFKKFKGVKFEFELAATK